MTFALDPSTVDDARPLLGRIVISNGAPDTEPQQQPMNLMRELFRGRRVTDPKCPGLFPAHPPVAFEQAEEQIADNVGRDVRLEEPIRNRLLPRELAVDTGLLTRSATPLRSPGR